MKRSPKGTIKNPDGPAEPVPKYRISARRPDAERPHLLRWERNMGDRDIAAEVMAGQNPGCVIEVRLTKGFKHNKPMKWRYEDGKLVATETYDQLAAGSRVPKVREKEGGQYEFV